MKAGSSSDSERPVDRVARPSAIGGPRSSGILGRTAVFASALALTLTAACGSDGGTSRPPGDLTLRDACARVLKAFEGADDEASHRAALADPVRREVVEEAFLAALMATASGEGGAIFLARDLHVALAAKESLKAGGHAQRAHRICIGRSIAEEPRG